MLSLIGIFIIIIGFILKIDTLAIVVLAGIATGFAGGLEFNDNGFEESVEEPSLMDDFDAFQFEDIVDELSLEDIEEATEEVNETSPVEVIVETKVDVIPVEDTTEETNESEVEEE